MGGIPDLFLNVYKSIFDRPIGLPLTTPMIISSVNYTNEYYFIIQMKLAHFIIVLSIAALIFLIYRFHRNIVTLSISSLFLSIQSFNIISLFSDLSLATRPILYTYLVFPVFVIVALNENLLEGLAIINNRIRLILRLLIISFLFLSALSLPILQNSDLPFLYSPTEEHAVFVFAINYLPGDLPILSTSYNAPGTFYIRLFQREQRLGQNVVGAGDWRNFLRNETELPLKLDGAVVLILGSSSKRDAFWHVNPTFSDSLIILRTYLHRTHSKVYDVGENSKLFMPVF